MRVARRTAISCALTRPRSGLSSDSIDYAVMEKTDRAAVVALDAGWSDIGSWSSLADVSSADNEGNVVRGDVLTHATRNSLLMSHHRLVAAVGIEDVVIVETSDAVLVVTRTMRRTSRRSSRNSNWAPATSTNSIAKSTGPGVLMKAWTVRRVSRSSA